MSRHGGDIRPNYREISVREFPNVWAAGGALARKTSAATAKSSSEHVKTVPIGTYHVNTVVGYALSVAKTRPDIVGTEAIRLLAQKREALGISMNAVATKAGLSHTMISRVERGLRNPTLDTLLRIAGALEVELWPLIKQAEEVSPLEHRKQ